jgi:hypothetical protein
MMMRWFIRMEAHKNLDRHLDALGQEFVGQGKPRPSLEAKADQNTRLT